MTKTYQKKLNVISNNFKYDKILNFEDRKYTVAILNGKSGLIDINGSPLTEFIYDDLSEEFEDDFGYEFGWVNFRNKYDKYCRMRLNDNWGLLDKNGNIVVDFKYSNPVQEWGENFIIELDKDEFSVNSFVMDKNNNIRLDLMFDCIYPRIGYAIVQKDYKYGILNKDLQLIIGCKYDYLQGGDGYKYLEATLYDKCGVIDLDENIILDFIYDKVTVEKSNNKYVFKAELNNKSALFNENGDRIA